MQSYKYKTGIQANIKNINVDLDYRRKMGKIYNNS